MGTWGYRPFENDTAADFVGDLDGVPQSERIEMLRAALVSVAHDDSTHVDGGRAEVSIAAAALAVRKAEGGDEFQPEVCGMPFGELPEMPKDLVSLAFSAVSRLLVKDNDLWDDWSRREDGAKWIEMLHRLRSVLDRESGAPQDSLW
ncbi:DUF4259 domain-containing protein [Streptomyces sp. NPDC052012]|uniref:DUF4259 domain-containing protein n=1 Tax=Streptomyces sp. NPDC052012 TaxID=3155051 RepID=UPI00344C189E